MAASDITVIRSSSQAPVFNFGALWEYRDLLALLLWRRISLRYQHTVVGLGWAILQPFATTLVFVVIIPRITSGQSSGVPYPLFTYTALAPWLYFTAAVTRASNCLVEGTDLLNSVYFPRVILPLVAVLEALVDFTVVCCVLVIFMLIYGVMPAPMALLAFVFVLMAVAAALGLGLTLSVLQVRYRDVFFIVQFLLQLGLILNPICYSIRIFKQPWRSLAGLNPMFGVIAGFRWAILGLDPPGWRMELLSASVIVLLLFVGLRVFRARQEGISDAL
jgi:lipopolysaccharide transport system permease protein